MTHSLSGAVDVFAQNGHLLSRSSFLLLYVLVISDQTVTAKHYRFAISRYYLDCDEHTCDLQL